MNRILKGLGLFSGGKKKNDSKKTMNEPYLTKAKATLFAMKAAKEAIFAVTSPKEVKISGKPTKVRVLRWKVLMEERIKEAIVNVGKDSANWIK